MTTDQINQALASSNLTMFNVAFWILIVWSMIWKGISMWKAARNQDKVWYIVLFILNTAGILDIIYIFVISRNKENA